MIVDLSITIGIPVLEMILGKRDLFSIRSHELNLTRLPFASEYIVAGHRFNIYEDIGCGPATWNTPLAYVLVWSWPLIISSVSAAYGSKSSFTSAPV